MTQADVIVVGAGLAGLAAAVELSEAGHRVTVLERAPVVGGRTSSWDEGGMHVESGLHRYLGFYTELPKLIRRVGRELDEVVVWQDEIEIITPDGGPRAVFGVSMIHRPLETLAEALGNNDFLPFGQKLALGRMIAAGAADYIAHSEEFDRTTVAEFARKHGVDEETIFRVLTPLTEGLFFVPPEEYSAFNFLGLIVPYWKSAVLARVGAFAGGMTTVLAQPFADFVREHDGRVFTNSEVEALLVEDGAVVGVRTSTGRKDADAVVLAASLGRAQSLVRAAFGGAAWCADMLQLKSTPSVTLQFELDEPALPVDRATFGPGTLLASFSEQSRSTFRGMDGRLSAILAQPQSLIDVPTPVLVDRVVADAKRLGIELEGRIRDYRKIVFPMDFYSLRPGSEARRPPQATPVRGLALAGDYTAQELLTTMEGAVVSGLRAAAVIREAFE